MLAMRFLLSNHNSLCIFFFAVNRRLIEKYPVVKKLRSDRPQKRFHILHRRIPHLIGTVHLIFRVLPAFLLKFGRSLDRDLIRLFQFFLTAFKYDFFIIFIKLLIVSF